MNSQPKLNSIKKLETLFGFPLIPHLIRWPQVLFYRTLQTHICMHVCMFIYILRISVSALLSLLMDGVWGAKNKHKQMRRQLPKRASQRERPIVWLLHGERVQDLALPATY